MEHIKKYWLGYLIAIVIIYFGWMYFTKQNANKISGGEVTNPKPPNPDPVNGKCPHGYVYLQPECITTPCEARCFPLGDTVSQIQ